MKILRVRTVALLNLKSSRSLPSFFEREARALLCTSSPKLGGVGINEQRRSSNIFRSEPIYMYYARARALRQSELNEYRIIDRKVGDGHRSYA